MFTPEEVAQAEYLLGIMIQNAKARGLKACKTAYYRQNGVRLGVSEVLDGSAKPDSCCPMGAVCLQDADAPDFAHYGGVARGNDGMTMLSDREALGYAVGEAFQDAMAEAEGEGE